MPDGAAFFSELDPLLGFLLGICESVDKTGFFQIAEQWAFGQLDGDSVLADPSRHIHAVIMSLLLNLLTQPLEKCLSVEIELGPGEAGHDVWVCCS